jgi:hypothetical protein
VPAHQKNFILSLPRRNLAAHVEPSRSAYSIYADRTVGKSHVRDGAQQTQLTQERYAHDICDGIAADLGGAAQRQILCQMFALKVLRVRLLVKTILSGEAVNRHTENYYEGAQSRPR